MKTMFKDCPMRSPDGNCIPIDGRCSTGGIMCRAFHSAYNIGKSDVIKPGDRTEQSRKISEEITRRRQYANDHKTLARYYACAGDPELEEQNRAIAERQAQIADWMLEYKLLMEKEEQMNANGKKANYNRLVEMPMEKIADLLSGEDIDAAGITFCDSNGYCPHAGACYTDDEQSQPAKLCYYIENYPIREAQKQMWLDWMKAEPKDAADGAQETDA